MKKVLVVIPSRYASTRFPGKPLATMQGKSMVQRVYEQAKKATLAHEVVVATDDDRIYEHVIAFGKAVMTDTAHNSGTDRCAEVAAAYNADIIINVQGDEPFILPEQIDGLIKTFEDEAVNIATLVKPITNKEDIFNPNHVKVVINQQAEAMYFSRTALPYIRGREEEEWLQAFEFYKHIGIYAFRKTTLLEVAKLPESSLEKAEKLEQLRWLESGYKIKIVLTEFQSPAVDTPEDLQVVEKFLKTNPDFM